MISIIVAQSNNRVIGKDNKLPWLIPNDMRHFKEITIGNVVIMGRKTYESIGKPLPKRLNIIVTRNKEFSAEGCIVVNSLASAIKKAGTSDIYIIGGGEIYKQSISISDRLLVTQVDIDVDGDAYFPEINSNWKINSKIDFKSDEKNPYNYSFIEYCKIH